EDTTGRARFQRLRGALLAQNLVHDIAALHRIAFFKVQLTARDDASGQSRVTIRKFAFGGAQVEGRAVAFKAEDAADARADFAVLSAGIHTQSSADGSRNALQTFQSRETLRSRPLHESRKTVSRADANACTFTIEVAEVARQANDQAADAFVGDQEIGSMPEEMHLDTFLRGAREQLAQQHRIVGLGEELSRTADAIGRHARQRNFLSDYRLKAAKPAHRRPS